MADALPWVRIKCHTLDGRIVIEITDTGIGIPPKDVPHICEHFYRVEGNQRIKHRIGAVNCKGHC
jgi:signal transduction histidine kinase